jgi:hypothetical protein
MGQLVGAEPPTCGWWRPVCISGDGVLAEEEDVGAVAPGVRAFSSLLRERIWRAATRHEVLWCSPPQWWWWVGGGGLQGLLSYGEYGR